MLKIVGDFRSLLLALWLGAACYFSFAVAPSAFGVLPTRDLAGSIVSRILLILNLSGIAVGIILLLSSFLPNKNAKTAIVWIERILLGILTLACTIGQFVIGVWMNQIRTGINVPIDDLPIDDAMRVQFNQLHIWSVNILVTAMVAALISYFLLAYRSRNTENKEVKKISEPKFADFKV